MFGILLIYYTKECMEIMDNKIQHNRRLKALIHQTLIINDSIHIRKLTVTDNCDKDLEMLSSFVGLLTVFWHNNELKSKRTMENG